MDHKNLDKAMEIFSLLLTGEEISKNRHVELYEAFSSNASVADILDTLLHTANLRLYEYNYALYLTSGDNNRVFGFTNDELKKLIGLRLNKELFLAYFIIFQTVTLFYQDSGSYSQREYVRPEDVIEKTSAALYQIVPKLEVLTKNEVEEKSFRTIALLWEDMPVTTNNEDMSSLKAARGTRVGFVKLVFNFLIEQNLFTELGGRYYAKDRFKALVENYYEDSRGRLYEIAAGAWKIAQESGAADSKNSVKGYYDAVGNTVDSKNPARGYQDAVEGAADSGKEERDASH